MGKRIDLSKKDLLSVSLVAFLLISVFLSVVFISKPKEIRTRAEGPQTFLETQGGNAIYNRSSYPPDPTGTCTSSNYRFVGQQYIALSYSARQTFLGFNTSIPTNATITGVTLRLKLYTPGNASDTDFIIRVRPFDFGSSIDCSDWRTSHGSNIVGTYNTVSLPADGSWFDIALNNDSSYSWINRSGSTRIYLTSDREECGTCMPTGLELISIDPAVKQELIINYTIQTPPPTTPPPTTPPPTVPPTSPPTPPPTGGPTPPPTSGPTPRPPTPRPSTIGGPRYTSEIRLNFDPLVYLVGKLPLKINIEETGENFSQEVSSTQTEVKLALKNKLTQGRGYNLKITSDKMIDKRVSFKPNNLSFAVNIGQILLGDFKKDNKIEAEDLKLILDYLAKEDKKGDLNYDLEINSLDYSVLTHSMASAGYDRSLPEGEGATLSLKLATQTQVKLGEDFNVDLWVDTKKFKSDGADLILTYDKDKLDFNEVLPGLAYAVHPYFKGSDGRIKITALSKEIGPYLEGNSLLATLNFKAKAEGEGKVDISYEPGKTQESNVSNQKTATDILTTTENLKLTISKEGLTASTTKKSGSLKKKGGLPNLSTIFFFLVALIIVAILAWRVYIFLKTREKGEGRGEGGAEVFIPPSVPLDRPPAI